MFLVFLNFIVLSNLKESILLFLFFTQGGSIEIGSVSVMSILCNIRDTLYHKNQQCDSCISLSFKLGGAQLMYC